MRLLTTGIGNDQSDTVHVATVELDVDEVYLLIEALR